MSSETKTHWGSSYKLIAAEKWKAKSAVMGRGVTQALVAYANPQPGMHALDLATGTGEPGISIAARVGSTGHVTAVDLSIELLELANQRAQARGFTNFSTRQADAFTSLPGRPLRPCNLPIWSNVLLGSGQGPPGAAPGLKAGEPRLFRCLGTLRP